MSIVTDQVRHLDVQVDRLSPLPALTADADHSGPQLQGLDGHSRQPSHRVLASRRVAELLRITKALSTSSTSRPLLQPYSLQVLLQQSGLTAPETPSSSSSSSASLSLSSSSSRHLKDTYESEVEWVLVAKATIQTYGIILDTLLGQIIPLSDEIWYWDQVLGSYTYSSLYALQTSPLRMWTWTKDVYHESRSRIRRLQHVQSGSAAAERVRTSLSQRWSQFYGIVRESITERSLSNIQQRILSPVGLSRLNARRKRAQLQRLREMTASGLGVLIDEGLSFGPEDELRAQTSDEWKGVVEKSVALMDMVLKGVLALDVGVADFEDKVFAGVEEDPELSVHIDEAEEPERPAILARRLLELLQQGLPGHVAATKTVWKANGRPSPLIRYWLPAGITLLSSSTILWVLVHRKEDVTKWIQDFGVTVRDFWFNWVVDPMRRVIGTIRHDSSSEIAIMSRDSLRADRESLERMVVDFAVERPDLAGGSHPLSEAQLADIRTKVREGDVTPVLRAYESDLRRPFVGAVRGNLVRALLIQVQKTKVDLEVAMSGIDALLKSQELVFGFVGLTPGVLVSIGLVQYLRTLLGGGGSESRRRSDRAERSSMVLVHIHRILSDAAKSQNNALSYKDHGLLVCEMHVLRTLMREVLPAHAEKEFLQDMEDLANLKEGIQFQLSILARIQMGYAKWLK